MNGFWAYELSTDSSIDDKTKRSAQCIVPGVRFSEGKDEVVELGSLD